MTRGITSWCGCGWTGKPPWTIRNQLLYSKTQLVHPKMGWLELSSQDLLFNHLNQLRPARKHSYYLKLVSAGFSSWFLLHIINQILIVLQQNMVTHQDILYVQKIWSPEHKETLVFPPVSCVNGSKSVI